MALSTDEILLVRKEAVETQKPQREHLAQGSGGRVGHDQDRPHLRRDEVVSSVSPPSRDAAMISLAPAVIGGRFSPA